jgi:hypothetical protein
MIELLPAPEVKSLQEFSDNISTYGYGLAQTTQEFMNPGKRIDAAVTKVDTKGIRLPVLTGRTGSRELLCNFVLL